MSQRREPSSEEDWITRALNIQGTFFERKCVRVIEETSGWSVISTNFPVEYPKSNSIRTGNESSLDIWARRITSDKEVLEIFIECKKANPDFVKWVFFPKNLNNRSANDPLRCLCQDRVVEGESSMAQRYRPAMCDIYSFSPDCKLFVASDAREVRGEYASHNNPKDKTKTSNTAIYGASSQISLATQCLIDLDQTCLDSIARAGESAAVDWKRKLYIPMVVTTANLFRLDFPIESVDILSGEIPLDDATLSPIESVIYEYPVPRVLQFQPGTSLQDVAGYEVLSRMHILIVHANHLSKFLTNFFPGEQPPA